MADNAQVVEEAPKDGGLFKNSLKRNNKQIRDDRAEGIAEDAQLGYQRKIIRRNLEMSKLLLIFVL